MTQFPIDEEIKVLKQDQKVLTVQLRRSKALLESLIALKVSGVNNNRIKTNIKYFEMTLNVYTNLVYLNGKQIQQLRQIKSNYIKGKVKNMSDIIDESKSGFVRMADVNKKETLTNLSVFADDFLKSIGKNEYKKHMFDEYALLNFGFSNIHISEVKPEYVTWFNIVSLGEDLNNTIIEYIKSHFNDEIVKGYFYSNVGNFFVDENGKYSLAIEDVNKVTGDKKIYKVTLM